MNPVLGRASCSSLVQSVHPRSWHLEGGLPQLAAPEPRGRVPAPESVSVPVLQVGHTRCDLLAFRKNKLDGFVLRYRDPLAEAVNALVAL